MILAAATHAPEISGRDFLALPAAGALLVAEPLVVAEPVGVDAVPIPESILDTYALSASEPEAFSGTDLNRDKKISADEIAAANRDMGSAEDETLRSLMQRFSVRSTYLDATGGEHTKSRETRIKEKAPSELRFTLFSIPLRE